MLDNEFPPLGGGTAVVNQHLLDEMARLPDVHVDLVTSSITRRDYEETRYAERIRVFKVPVDNRDLHHSTHVELLRYSGRGLLRARRLLRHNRYDLSFAFSGLPAGAVSMALQLDCGLPYVVSLQGRDVPGFDLGYPLYAPLTPVIKLVWRRAAAVVAISSEHRKLALRCMPELDIAVIHNGVDTVAFHPPAAVDTRRPLTFLCVGRLVERKGHRYLLEAFARLRRRSTVPLRLAFAGQGEIEGALRAQAERLGIAGEVRFLGYVARGDIAAVYREADVFVLASQNEGMSIALLEAMASGLPVIVTRAGGTAELVEDGVNGLIVPWADVAALAAALGRFVDEPSLQREVSAQNRQRAEQFSWPAITRQYLDLCESALRQRAPARLPVSGSVAPRQRLRVCILASQYFAWGKYGGFGSMARKLAESLAGAGHEVSVLVPRRAGQPAAEVVNGVKVESFAPFAAREVVGLLRRSSADVFHSQDPTVLTWLAQKIHPRRAHLVTCRDPRDLRDWRIEFALASARRRWLTPFNYLTESAFLARLGVRGADAVYCPAEFLRTKVQRLFRPRQAAHYLPNLIDVPAASPRKSEQPTFVFLARFDRRKRPEKFLALAERFPEHRFVAAGAGEDPEYDADLRRRFGHLKNLELPGFVDRFAEGDRLASLLGEAWALVSTAAREGLPLSFLEAAAQSCALVSGVDPDGFASRFGVHVRDDDYAAGLEALLSDDPLGKGMAARAHVQATCETSIALAAHIAEYERFS